MPMILYTDRQGGEWKPWNTPLSWEELQYIVTVPECVVGNKTRRIRHGQSVSHICHDLDGTFFFELGDDCLPQFHSILLSTAARWDVTNRKWTFYICGDAFEVWWKTYIAHFNPEEEPEERKYWWLDQGVGWSIYGVREPRTQTWISMFSVRGDGIGAARV